MECFCFHCADVVRTYQYFDRDNNEILLCSKCDDKIQKIYNDCVRYLDFIHNFSSISALCNPYVVLFLKVIPDTSINEFINSSNTFLSSINTDINRFEYRKNKDELNNENLENSEIDITPTPPPREKEYIARYNAYDKFLFVTFEYISIPKNKDGKVSRNLYTDEIYYNHARQNPKIKVTDDRSWRDNSLQRCIYIEKDEMSHEAYWLSKKYQLDHFLQLHELLMKKIVPDLSRRILDYCRFVTDS